MNYEDFKNEVKENILAYMPKKYRGYEVVISSLPKTKETLDCITLTGPSVTIFPTIYVDHMYKQYLENENFQETMEKAADMMAEGFERAPKGNVPDFDNAKDNIFLQVINTKQNEEQLSNVQLIDN